ncbi:MAG: adenylyl-sulfate kinase [Rhodospirillaceae bacterium]
MISHLDDAPIETNVLRARIFWLGDEPLSVGDRYRMRLGTADVQVDVEQVERVVDTSVLRAADAKSVPKDSVADVVLRSRAMLALDPAENNPQTGRIVLAHGDDLVGGGLVDMDGYPDQRQLITRRSTNVTAVDHAVTEEMRMARNGHRGGVLWFTGLSGSGKSTLAIALEQALFERNFQVFVLDGDNLRHGLNGDLGFSDADRQENIRRVTEVAAIFAEAGMVVISAFISPFTEDRESARQSIGEGFHEISLDASLEVCERRDPKGLYKQARAGKIADFTGISSPYERPRDPALVLDTGSRTVDACLAELLDFAESAFR